jgi:hypothetical protein
MRCNLERLVLRQGSNGTDFFYKAAWRKVHKERSLSRCMGRQSGTQGPTHPGKSLHDFLADSSLVVVNHNQIDADPEGNIRMFYGIVPTIERSLEGLNDLITEIQTQCPPSKCERGRSYQGGYLVPFLVYEAMVGTKCRDSTTIRTWQIDDPYIAARMHTEQSQHNSSKGPCICTATVALYPSRQAAEWAREQPYPFFVPEPASTISEPFFIQ